MPSQPLRVAVVGAGHLGSRHAHIYASLPGVRLVAVCDQNPARAKVLAKSLRCLAFTRYQDLFGEVDAVSLATPTSTHGAIGLALLRRAIHVLVEKPISTTLAQADALIKEASKRRCVLQIGHIERFNAAIHAAQRYLTHPRFIEVHRLSPYPFRGTDVSVVLDVMVHDLDMLLLLVRKPVTRLDAIGVPVLSRSEDIANARLQFRGGCIANLTASRISDEPVRRIRVFQEDRYLSIDYKAQTVELAHTQGRAIRRVNLPVNRRPPLQDELVSFIQAIRHRRRPPVTGEDGRAALALALRIEQAMRRSATSHKPQVTTRKKR